MSILEAMHFKVPVCASSVDGNVEALADERGLLFPAGDVDKAFACIKVIRYGGKKIADMTKLASDYSSSEFNFVNHVQKHLTLYSDLLKTSAK
jgi:glycosyltransferase involved in cell wall biosynthesis